MRRAGRSLVFESAAILQYLGRKTGQFYPADEPTRARIDSWLFWQMAGLGPMSGQVNYFTRAAQKPERDPRRPPSPSTASARETKRLFGVLERGLQGRDYLCGDYSIADMCSGPGSTNTPTMAAGLAIFRSIAAWHARIAARPAVQRALAGRSMAAS